MIVYLCNKCKKPINLANRECAHLQVTLGSGAIQSGGQLGDGYSIDLCEGCYKSTLKQIDCFTRIGNNIMKEQV